VLYLKDESPKHIFRFRPNQHLSSEWPGEVGVGERGRTSPKGVGGIRLIFFDFADIILWV